MLGVSCKECSAQLTLLAFSVTIGLLTLFRATLETDCS
jgi:hypothetical protein